MNKKNCPNKNKSFPFPFLNLVLDISPRTYFLSFIKKIILSLFLLSSVSATAFFSANTQNHCALPLYMAALQSGLLQGQTRRGSSVAAQKEAARRKMTAYSNLIKSYQGQIEEYDDKIKDITRQLSRGFGEGGKDVMEQVIDHIGGEQSKRNGDDNRCSEDEINEMDVYYRRGKDSYFAKLSSAITPPPFSFALLHKIAQASLSQMIPSVVAKVVKGVCIKGGKDVSYTQNGQNCICKGSNGQVIDCKDPESARNLAAENGPSCGVPGGYCRTDQKCCPSRPPHLDARCIAKTASCSPQPTERPDSPPAATESGASAETIACGTKTCNKDTQQCCDTAPNQCFSKGATCPGASAETITCGTKTCNKDTQQCCDNQCLPKGDSDSCPRAEADDEATECDHWRRWRECAEKDGDIDKKLLCGSPEKCRHLGDNKSLSVLELKRPGSKDKCVGSLEELAGFLKAKKELEEKIANLVNKHNIANDALEKLTIAEIEGTASATEAGDPCPDCALRRMRELKEIIDPAPSGWDIFGNVVGTLGAAALGYYGIKEANKLRDAQGLGAQPGYALGLAYPFIMKGLHGGGLFGGNSSSLACSPTAGTMGGNVFQQAFLAQQIQRQQQMHYMQQMQLMRAYYSSMPGNVGTGINMGIPGMGNNMFPNVGAGINFGIPGMGNNMFPNMGAGINFGIPGMGNNMFPNMGAGINFGIPGMGNMGMNCPAVFPPIPGCGSGFNNGMMGAGNMQAQLQYRQAMMAAYQTQMQNYMQREQAVGELMSQISQLQMQIWNIRNGGINVNLGGGGNTNNNNNNNVGGGGNDDTLDTTQMIRDF